MIKSVKVSNRLHCYNPKGTRDNKMYSVVARAQACGKCYLLHHNQFFARIWKNMRHSTNQRFHENGCAFKNTFTARCTCFL